MEGGRIMRETEEKAAPVWVILLVFIIVIFLFVGNLFFGLNFNSLAEAGQFGDMFGAVNAMFSGLAFAGVCYAIILQRNEIKIARSEIRYTRIIMEEQKENIKKQNISIQTKSFEDTFFRMLEFLTGITDKIRLETVIVSSQRMVSGKESFTILLKRLRRKLEIEVRPFDEYYEDFYRENNAILGHYFRFLFNVMNFIDNSEIENKEFYAKIVRAQLSDDEVAVLFYNGLSARGKRFKPLIERYGLLKNLNDRSVMDSELIPRYEAAAFGARGRAT
jgi:hypothetical protein